MANPRKHWKIRRASSLLALASGLGLMGCLPPDTTIQDYNPLTYGNWRQIPARPDVFVESVKLVHYADFEPQSVRLDAVERDRLQQFMAEGNLRLGDRIEVQVPQDPYGAATPKISARSDYMRDELSGLGLPITVVETPALPGGANYVAVVVNRAVVMTPDCDTGEPWIANRPDYQVGCAYNSALGMMVADPRDLVRGRLLGPADAESTARGIKGYREPAQRDQDDGGLNIESTSDN
ncbi:MAG: CpaD family pilus assembly lipoprotein [Kiloniellales bacterium]|nr:CpaD family pilus assembly lipoprotein [Kiloniellales bacterium]